MVPSLAGGHVYLFIAPKKLKIKKLLRKIKSKNLTAGVFLAYILKFLLTQAYLKVNTSISKHAWHLPFKCYITVKGLISTLATKRNANF